MANEEHLDLLNQGIEDWNKWRKQNLRIQPDLIEADLGYANLRGANLSSAYLMSSNLGDADLSDANLSGANLMVANLGYANLCRANLSGANLTVANLSDADLIDANLSRSNLTKAFLFNANLSGADLIDANLRGTDLSGADLSGANLMFANLISTKFENTKFQNCRIYGISAWNLKLQGAVQSDLIITLDNEPTITVDNLEVAQFIYFLLNNEKIREVIDTISRKVVLILGRFGEHKAVLDAIRNELRNHDYLPVLFDFEKPTNRDLTETVRTLAHLARFIIADITEPRSIPQELQAIVPHLAVPVQPLILEGSTGEYAMFQDLSKYQWVLPIHQYKDIDYLLDSLGEKVIAPAEAKAQELEKR